VHRRLGCNGVPEQQSLQDSLAMAANNQMTGADEVTRTGFVHGEYAMSTRRMRLASVALLIGLLFFAASASADQRADAMADDVMVNLRSAMFELSLSDNAVPESRKNAMHYIEQAIDRVTHYRQESR